MKTLSTITLLTGGAKSGKSTKALNLASAYTRKAFIATAEAFDADMTQRIARHKSERDASFTTIEEPLNLADALASVSSADVVIIDCLTVWVANLLHHRNITSVEAPEITEFLHKLGQTKTPIIIVTNETNLGIMPANESARLYGNILGALNQKTAALATKVILMVSGLEINLK